VFKSAVNTSKTLEEVGELKDNVSIFKKCGFNPICSTKEQWKKNWKIIKWPLIISLVFMVIVMILMIGSSVGTIFGV
jgi:hypothetical protein